MKPLLRVDCDAPLQLPRGTGAWHVLTGQVEVYLTGGARRRLIGVIAAGGDIFPLPPRAGLELLLVAVAPATLVPADGDLAASARAWTGDSAAALPAEPAAIVAHVQAWTTALDARLDAEERERDAQLLARLAAAGQAGETDDAAALRWLLPELDPGSVPPGPDLAARLRAAGIRLREVTLAPDWPRRDAGPLLLRGDSGLCAVRWHRGGWRRADGTRLPDPAAFDRRALAVHAPFAAAPAGLIGFVRFVLPDLLRDFEPRLVAGLALACLGAAVPVATGAVIDDILPAGDGALAAAIGLALVVAAGFSALLTGIQSLIAARGDGRSGLRFAAALTDHVLRLPAGFFRTLPAGDCAARLQAAEEMRAMIVSVTVSTGLTAIMALAWFALMFGYDGRLAAIGVALTLCHGGAVAVARVRQMRPLRAAAILDGKLADRSYEMLDGVPKLRSAVAEERALERWNRLWAEERRTMRAAVRVGGHFAAFSAGFELLAPMLFFAAAMLLAAPRPSPGAFLAFMTSYGLFQAAFARLCEQTLALWAAQPLAERAAPILAARPEAVEGRLDPGPLQGMIEVSGLSFGYDPAAPPLLDGLSFRVEAGQHLAIVGGSGSGKSTILRLLLGFETPRAGSIAYDGQELARLEPARLRRQIGTVLQSSQLFSGTIYENIRGASDADLEQCLAAARAAGLGPDLDALGMGIHTPVSEGGGTFSGGQRQRILIARALAARPRILFLDEATSALDNLTQALVAETLDGLAVTRLTIAHRLSTVRKADCIAVLENGRFVETGRFDELMAKGGAFAALARRQLLED